jgi:TolB-like protein
MVIRNFKLTILISLLVFGCFTQVMAQDGRPRTVAVWDFDNNSFMDIAKVDYLARVLPEILLNNLSGVSGLKLIERVHLRESLEELKIGSGDLASEGGRLKLGKLIGTREMIFGAYMAIGDQLRVDVRVVDVETSLTLFARQFNADINSIMPDMEKLSKAVAEKLGGESGSVNNGSLAENSGIWQEYNKGIVLMDKQKYAQAIEVFKSILGKDANFKLAEKQIGFAIERLSRQ